jgi:Mlc titration factor MtfA (ptsG expression regulator)
MFLRWWKRRRRRRYLSQPFPETWNAVLHKNVWQYQGLAEPEQVHVRDYVQIFVAEKHWEGCGGFSITDEVQVTIAAQVGILVLGLPGQFFEPVQSILVYPDAFVAPDTTITRAGVVLEGGSPRTGEAWYRGPIILSWADVVDGGRGPNWGENLVFHEFAHQLDMLNGHIADGVPPMTSPEQYRRWADVMASNYRRLVQACEKGHQTLLDSYGTTSVSEFFAVATETFFQLPRAMQRDYPALYEILRDFYQQDPAARTD